MKSFFGCMLVLIFCAALAQGRESSLVFCCSKQNDLYAVVGESGYRCKRFDDPTSAIKNAARGSAVLLLADGYPLKQTEVAPDALKLAAEKDLRLFIEYPATNALPGIVFGSVRTTEWERGVVSSDVFGTNLPKLRIVAVHDCNYLPITNVNPWLVIARVAGFDVAPYGIPRTAAPLLFDLPERHWIIATTKLSHFVTGRYAPTEDWKVIWQTILGRLDPDHAPFHLKWHPTVAPKYSAAEKLPRHFERKAFDASAKWITNSRLLLSPTRTNAVWTLLRQNTETISAPYRNEPADGTLGIQEGYASGIRYTGNQLQRLPLRADCQLESAMVLALDSKLNGDRRSLQVARNLTDFVYFNSGMCAGPRADEKHGAFGLIAWGDISPAWLVANYGDDDARAMLATMSVSASLKDPKWNEALTKALIANFRTTGKFGFRGDRIDVPALENGWKQFFNSEVVSYSPHFESYLWACNLWAYRATGYRPFFEKATNAIAMTMKAYPAGWRWQDNNERSRMLLSLSWLIRLEDTAQHREWLMTVANDLLKRQQPNGAIHEWLGGTGGGHYHIPQSNEAYGTGETPLIQKNGDPASDQLYTTGFSLLGLHEAAAATGDIRLKEAENKLAEFLCRIQIRSEKIPYMDGWWFRAFDDRRWEYWSSSADAGWGPWSIEAGWAQAWTATVLALREQKTTFWDMTSKVDIKKDFEQWRPRMLE